MSEQRMFYGWVVLGAAAAMICMAMGALFSLAVFLKPVEETMGWSRSAISSVALVNWLFMGLGSFAWGALSDRLGARRVSVAGGLLLGLSLVVSSQVATLWQFYLTFGAGVGFAVGAFYAPLSATATRWFTANRGLAVGVVSGGIGVGILIVSPLARWLITLTDWRTAMLLLGDLVWLVIVPVALLIRNAPADLGLDALGGDTAHAREYSAAEVFRSRQFWVISLTHLACCAAHSGPIFHMVTHAMDQGLPALVAATALGVSGFTSIAGRVGCGVLADRFGARRTLVAGLALQAAMVLLYLLARDVPSFYLLAVVFGIAYGGVMPLYAIVTREYFGPRIMGTAYGAVFFVSTLGMGLGSYAGGAIYDHLGSYAWLYVASGAIGGAAATLALAFPAPRRAPAQRPATAIG
jgi:MFS family permease